jgi:hypothetical protein
MAQASQLSMPMQSGRSKVAIRADIDPVGHLSALVIFVMALVTDGSALAQTTPLPRPRPPEGTRPVASNPSAADQPAPSACRLRLTDKLVIAPSLPPILGPVECGGEDLVELEAVVLPDKSRVAVTPPATVNCRFAEVIAAWVRQDIAPAARALGSALKSIDNYASYDCRGRNRIFGAKLSEHGKANALDVRSLALANGRVVRLTDLRLDREFRARLRARTCSRFMTVLGPGSDGYHEDHIHVDLAERRGGHRMCHWEIREEEEEASPAASAVPLPRPRPARG